MLSYGFTNALSDASLFIFRNGGAVIYFLVYVDDLIFTGNQSSVISQFFHALAKKFSIKDLGDFHYFLGVEVVPTNGGLFLSQHKYIRELLTKVNMEGAKEVSTSLFTSDSLVLHDGYSLTDATMFRRLVSGLQYLSFTRPDISFAVNKFS